MIETTISCIAKLTNHKFKQIKLEKRQVGKIA